MKISETAYKKDRYVEYSNRRVDILRDLAKKAIIIVDNTDLHGYSLTDLERGKIYTHFTFLELFGYLEYRTIDIENYMSVSSHLRTIGAKMLSAQIHNEIFDEISTFGSDIVSFLPENWDKIINKNEIILPSFTDIANATISDVRIMDRLRDKVTNNEYLDIEYRLGRYEDVLGRIALSSE